MNGVTDHSAGKILVVDDNLVVLKALSLALQSKGYEVISAIDGPEAFSIARLEKLDLILLDIFFPPDVAQSGNTWDGFLIMDWFRHIGVNNIPIVIISGAEPVKFRERCLAAGAVEFLAKPVNIPVLLHTIQKILGRNPNKAKPEPAVDFVL